MGISSSKATSSYFAGNESMFGNNTLVTGGYMVQAKTFNLIQRNEDGYSNAYRVLQERVATSAWHNSVQRVDPPVCHPKTREAILEQIFNWIRTSAEDRDNWVMWLNGAAGAGKSAIAQSIAQLCVEDGIAVASFFFSRTDPTRNSVVPLIATLAYQLIQIFPETKDDVLQIIDANPLIFAESLQSQFQALIVDPLIHAQAHPRRSSLPLFFVVLVDGIDECINRDLQCNLVNTIGNIVSSRSVPIVFLTSSRREPQLVATFKRKYVASMLATLRLDGVAQATDDIRRFLNDQFSDLKETHPHGNTLPSNWPSPSAVEEIVTKSSGQFIYASISMKYISSPRTNPLRQLNTIVNGISTENPSTDNPFAHLDALYRHIFSEVANLDMVLDILAYVLFSGSNNVGMIRWTFELAPGDVEAYLADLSSVITISGEENRFSQPTIEFLHASLPDFLRDRRRSDIYYIDPGYYNTKLACLCLAYPKHGTRTADVLDSVESPLPSLLRKSKPTEQLRHMLLKFGPGVLRRCMSDGPVPGTKYAKSMLAAFLYAVKCLDFNDEQQVYNLLLDEVSHMMDRKGSIYVPGIRERAAQAVVSDLQQHGVPLTIKSTDLSFNQD